MKTIINNEATNTLEFFKRFLYSFQVLIVGIAIPVLFIIGISTKEQKQPPENEIRTHNSELTVKPVKDVNVTRM
jgi:hypothetical protein